MKKASMFMCVPFLVAGLLNAETNKRLEDKIQTLGDLKSQSIIENSGNERARTAQNVIKGENGYLLRIPGKYAELIRYSNGSTFVFWDKDGDNQADYLGIFQNKLSASDIAELSNIVMNSRDAKNAVKNIYEALNLLRGTPGEIKGEFYGFDKEIFGASERGYGRVSNSSLREKAQSLFDKERESYK
ncbi:hypothetical protein DRN69_02605 [Candidatus Pacearchaeota archaeon]|nr:MAG: hypothetical protein DRN69_02605 [Candidatus Pacearchaeota archaeon]